MPKIFHFILGFVLCFAAFDARAEIFVWKDGLTNISLSFPDRWAVVNNQKPNDILTIAGPTNRDNTNDMPQCRMRVHDDKRFAIYPARYDGAIQRLNVSGEFWDQYVNEFDNATVLDMRNDAALGQGYASFAHFRYEVPFGDGIAREGMAFASLYNNKINVFECASVEGTFSKWERSFYGIAASVNLYGIRSGHPHGYYRDFMDDKTLRIHNRRPVEGYTF